MKIGLRLFLVRFDCSDEDGAEMGISYRRGGRLGHCDTLESTRNSGGVVSLPM